MPTAFTSPPGRVLLPLALAALLPGGLAAQPPMRIEFLDPGAVAVPVGGWPLTLRLSAPYSEVCLGSEGPAFKGAGDTGFLVFGATDCREPYESFVQFTLDVDAPGVPDSAGDSCRRLHLTESDEPAPKIPISGSPLPRPIGPPTGGGVLDGYGYGADDDLPGLVLLADRGPGARPGLQLGPPASRANLAGLLNAVSFEIAAPGGRVAILAHMVVPTRLLSPLLLVDTCVGSPPGTPNCTGGTLHQLDNGFFRVGKPTPEELAAPVTLRAFLVADEAPSILKDCNEDGVVDARDVQSQGCGGYTLLSAEATLRVRTVYVQGGEETAFMPADLDGNGVPQEEVSDGLPDDFSAGSNLCPMGRSRRSKFSLTPIPR